MGGFKIAEKRNREESLKRIWMCLNSLHKCRIRSYRPTPKIIFQQRKQIRTVVGYKMIPKYFKEFLLMVINNVIISTSIICSGNDWYNYEQLYSNCNHTLSNTVTMNIIQKTRSDKKRKDIIFLLSWEIMCLTPHFSAVKNMLCVGCYGEKLNLFC